jgi:hypothetical protein
VAVQRSLGEYVELVPVYTFDEAVKRLRAAADIELILCGIYFAQTRMFDLLRVAKAEFPSVPFVACRIGETEIPQVTLEAVAIASRSLGAATFLNIPLLRPDDGADQEFRSRVLAELKSTVQLR